MCICETKFDQLFFSVVSEMKNTDAKSQLLYGSRTLNSRFD